MVRKFDRRISYNDAYDSLVTIADSKSPVVRMEYIRDLFFVLAELAYTEGLTEIAEKFSRKADRL